MAVYVHWLARPFVDLLFMFGDGDPTSLGELHGTPLDMDNPVHLRASSMDSSGVPRHAYPYYTGQCYACWAPRGAAGVGGSPHGPIYLHGVCMVCGGRLGHVKPTDDWAFFDQRFYYARVLCGWSRLRSRTGIRMGCRNLTAWGRRGASYLAGQIAGWWVAQCLACVASWWQ